MQSSSQSKLSAAIHLQSQEDPHHLHQKSQKTHTHLPSPPNDTPHPTIVQLRMESMEHHPPVSEVTGSVGRKLLDCEKCDQDSQAKTYVRHPIHEWCISVRCRQHPVHDGWWVCIACNIQRKRMVTPDQIHRHYRVYHLQGPTKRARLSPPNCGFQQM